MDLGSTSPEAKSFQGCSGSELLYVQPVSVSSSPFAKAFRKIFGPLHYEPLCFLTVAGNNQPVPSPPFSQSFFLSPRVPADAHSLHWFCLLPEAEAFVPDLETLDLQGRVPAAFCLQTASMQPDGQAWEEMGSSL